METISSVLGNSSFSLIRFSLWGSSLTTRESMSALMILETDFVQFANSISLISSVLGLLYSRFHLHLVTYLSYDYLQLIWHRNFIFRFISSPMMDDQQNVRKYLNYFKYSIKLKFNYHLIVLFYSILRAFSFLFLFFIIYSFKVREQFYLSH